MKIIEASISDLMEEKFVDYAREVIEDRAIPDVRDGLKPVQRRILWSMYDSKYLPDGKFRKSARVVGDVMGMYHPHGDSSVYGAMVKQAQGFVRRMPLISGQGNWGTIDDNPAAMRYTEAKLAQHSMLLLEGIKKEIVPFVENYDGTKLEPKILPARIPNLLINGTQGIAVGMTSDILPHNPQEVIDATLMLLSKPEATVEDLMQAVKGPDFPTGGIIHTEGLKELYESGTGAITCRGEVMIEEAVNTRNVVIYSLPYQSSLETLLKRIGTLAENHYESVVKDIRDESSEDTGVRVVIEVAKETDVAGFIEDLYKKTDLEKRFTSHMVALLDSKPIRFNLREMLEAFLKFRRDTLQKDLQDQLNMVQGRLHILHGLKIAVENIDEVIRIIRKSDSPAVARAALKKRFSLSDEQGQAVLDTKLSRLTKLQLKDLMDEIKKFEKEEARLLELLGSQELRDSILKKELSKIRSGFDKDERRTRIMPFDEVSFVPEVMDDSVVLQAVGTKLKRRPAGFSGKKGVVLKTNMAQTILIFLKNGKCIRQTVGLLPEKLESEVVAMAEEVSFSEHEFVLVVFKNGFVKKSRTADLVDLKSPYDYCKLTPKNEVLSVLPIGPNDKEMVLLSKNGQAIRFDPGDINETGRIGIGVVALKLAPDDVLEEACLNASQAKEFRRFAALPVQNRGGKGKRFGKF